MNHIVHIKNLILPASNIRVDKVTESKHQFGNRQELCKLCSVLLFKLACSTNEQQISSNRAREFKDE